jgi:hypothetical protein
MVEKKLKIQNDLLNELLTKQLKNISNDIKLKYSDIKRISKYLNSSIFDENKCSFWTGYITNEKNISKGVYVNFYFNGSKMALHRLLYSNYVDKLGADEYLKFGCENKGKCCNITHLRKFKYTTQKPIQKPTDNKLSEDDASMNKNNKIKKHANKNRFDDLLLSFD